ncbi:MAG: diguanylate cyclase [Deltaproteobacteria bacterium]|nr:diguanylate cyclase [Deltaproteobacteria bacterium]
MNTGVCIAQDEKIVMINQRLADALGYGSEEIVGRPFAEFFAVDDLKRVREAYRRHMSGEREIGLVEAKVRHGAGGLVPIEMNGSIVNYHGKPAEMVIVHDTTISGAERQRLLEKQDALEAVAARRTEELRAVLRELREENVRREAAEKNLRESSQRIEAILRHLPGMAYRCLNDRPWTMIYVSDGVLNLTGHPDVDLIDNKAVSYAQLIHPDDREKVWQTVQEATANERPFEMTYRIRAAGGAEKWVWEQGRAMIDADGTPILSGFIMDVTDRVNAERVVKESEERYRLLVAQAADAIFLTDAEGRIVECNVSCARLLSYPIRELTGMLLDDLATPDEHYQESIVRCIERGERCAVRRLMRRDGTIIVAEVNGRVLTNGFIQGIIRDVTEQRRKERALRQVATHDRLTGLFNRGHVMERFEREFGRVANAGGRLCVCLCDLDEFKNINDTHGHRAGDHALSSFAQIVRRCIRPSDVAGRYGGDEFLMLFPDLWSDEALLITERIRRSLEDQEISLGSASIRVTASFGLADIHPKYRGSRHLFDAADRALYLAKNSGRNRSVTFLPPWGRDLDLSE